MDAPFDPGLQPERTELAWRRTCLALGIGSLVAMRVLPAAFDSAWWVLAGAAALVATAGLWLWARRRYLAVGTVLHRDGDRGRLPGAGLIFALTAFVMTIALTSLGVTLAVATDFGSPL